MAVRCKSAVVDAGTTTNLNLHLSGSSLVDAGGNTYAYSGGVITLTEAAPGNGNTISVTATETNVNSNVSSQGTASATQHTALPDTPTVSIPEANASGVISWLGIERRDKRRRHGYPGFN